MKICIDAGHGQNQNLGVYNNYYEGNGNFALQELLAPLLQAKGFEVVKTRHSITDNPELEDRGNMAKGCNMFLSLHSDAGGSNSFVTAIRSLKRPDSQELGEKLAKGVKDLISADVSDVTLSIYGGAINGVWTRAYSSTNTTTDYYGVIRSAVTHSECTDVFLLECGHHTHMETCKWLDSGSNRQKLAETLANIIANHFKATTEPEILPTSAQETFISLLVPLAQESQRTHQLLTSVTLSQAILESGYGTSELSQNANNMFGIKATDDWQGETYDLLSPEYINGVWTEQVSTFRKYTSTADCINDRALKLTVGWAAENVYKGIVGETDVNKAVQCLSGWATAPNYTERLLELIEQWNLTQYDLKVEPTPEIPEGTIAEYQAIILNLENEIAEKDAEIQLYKDTISIQDTKISSYRQKLVDINNLSNI